MASTVEGTYPSVLQGVSQQTPSLRLDGQVHEQTNMLSDIVTGIRRRPAMPLVNSVVTQALNNYESLFTCYIDRGVLGYHLIINTFTGDWALRDKKNYTVVTSGQDDYFKASSGRAIQTAALGMSLYIVNTEQKVWSFRHKYNKDPSTTGYLFVKTSAFNTTYSVSVLSRNFIVNANYTTPNGLNAGDTDKATPHYIAERLEAILAEYGVRDKCTMTRNNQFICFTGGEGVSVTTTTANMYMGVSGAANVNAITDLPSRLPNEGHLMMVSVGADPYARVWYKYDGSTQKWIEDAEYGSIKAIVGTPRCLEPDNTMATPVFEGREAGDDTTNDDPAFVANEIITGIGSYQGRLVLLSGPYVSMSDSANPHRFYRRTVTQLLPSDRIDIGSGSTQNTIFRSCTAFNRDLVLFGDSVQALIASSGAAITSQTAAVILTSQYSCEARITPVSIGNTLLYPFMRSAEYSGLWELVPSSYTSSQYQSVDATAHIPEYIRGNIKNLVSSSSSTIAVATTTNDPRELYVYEYQWGPEGEKLQSAWHKWIAPLPVLSVHFAHEKLYIFMGQPKAGVSLEMMVCSVIDPREGLDTQMANNLPYIDLYDVGVVSNGVCQIPQRLKDAGVNPAHLVLTRAAGDYANGEVQVLSTTPTTLYLGEGTPDGVYYVGLPYQSSMTLTPAFLRDENGKVFGVGKTRLVEVNATIQNSGVMKATVQDVRTGVDETMVISGALLNSDDVALGTPIEASSSTVYVPCRTNADTTLVQFKTDGIQDMNIVSVDYKLRFNFNRRR